MNANVIAAFLDELEKNAAAPKVLQRLWDSGLGRAAAGSAIGAAGGALANPEDRARGALLGGALGAGAGYAAPLLTRAGRRKAWEGTKHLGRKAKHEVTGIGNVPLGKNLSAKEVAEMKEMQRLGLTSVPGVVKGLATRPLSTMKGAWQHAGGAGKVMAVGDLALGAPRIMDPNTQEGTAEKALGTLGSAGGYLIGGRMGLLGSGVMGTGLGYLGSRAGRLFGGGAGAQASTPGTMMGRPTTAAVERAVGTPVRRAVPEIDKLMGPR